MNHVMIDLETFDTRPTAAIRSIGAVFFDPDTGEQGSTFHMGVTEATAFERGTVSHATIAWWRQQDKAAQDAFDTLLFADLDYALVEFKNFLDFARNGREVIVWGNGATFDISILDHAYRHKAPWKFWNVRDVRTICHLADKKLSKESFPFEGVKHSALDDARHQAKYVSAMWQALRGK